MANNYKTVSELFTIQKSPSVKLGDLIASTTGIPVVSSTCLTNGVQMRSLPLKNKTNFLFSADSITVAINGSVLETFIQPEDFYKTQDVHVLYSINPAMTIEEKMWWVVSIRSHQFRFNYGRKAGTDLPQLLLPADIPDWVYGTNKNALNAIAAAVNAECALQC